jgi:predicted nuclease of predicted toxin-antitoxin system
MRILIDECVDPRVAAWFDEHDAKTVREMGWDQLLDGPLLQLAAPQFDVFLTIDRSIEFQQNLSMWGIGVNVVEVPKNQMRYFLAVEKELSAAVDAIRPGRVIHVRVEPQQFDRSAPWCRGGRVGAVEPAIHFAPGRRGRNGRIDVSARPYLPRIGLHLCTFSPRHVDHRYINS